MRVYDVFAAVMVALCVVLFGAVIVVWPEDPLVEDEGELARAVGDEDELDYALYVADELGHDVTLVDATSDEDVTLKAIYYVDDYRVAGIVGDVIYVWDCHEMVVRQFELSCCIAMGLAILWCTWLWRDEMRERAYHYSISGA